MKIFRIVGVVAVLGILLPAAISGCQSTVPNRSTPIRSDRQVEELIFDNGAAHWRKVGNVSVRTGKSR